MKTKLDTFPKSFCENAPVLYHITERNSSTAYGLFHYASWYHLREKGRRQAAAPHPAESWQDFSKLQKTGLDIVRFTHTKAFNVDKTLIIWLDPILPELAYQRVISRGQKHEVSGFDFNYMTFLWRAQKAFCGDEVQLKHFAGNIVPLQHIYPPHTTSLLRIEVDHTISPIQIVDNVITSEAFTTFWT
ncbi:hypothetical protein HOLleu_28074 [Holothuria leucospilota]|uniref:Uncharacterized protein n=1 Tax=Holothuria leucospilota TaxID=206669 RepID=A0A9Q1H3P8_HOLLE|nr:hypothetical protein HOLleu_28074 [Holothuria leucospilota]